MNFFTSPADIKGWVKIQPSADDAATKIMDIIGKNEEQDVVDTCRAIYNDQNPGSASEILFEVMAKHNLARLKEGKMSNKIIKEAQIMRQPGQYPMDLKVCPKLPNSVGKKLISTYNCRHYCLDSIVLDEDPNRVYCAEALWRRHVMDKFSREFKNKEGKWVGGYINERFQVFHDDGGNQMELAHGERSRKPRPHQYSTERRLSEGRGEETYDLEASDSARFVKLASVGSDNASSNDPVYQVFNDIIEMKEAGLKDADVLMKVSDHYGMGIDEVAVIQKLANKQMDNHNGVKYAYNSKQIKTAQMFSLPERSTMVTNRDLEIIKEKDGQRANLKIETDVVMASSGNNPVFEVVGGPDAGLKFKLANTLDLNGAFEIEDGANEKIQDAADEVGLNDVSKNEEFPIAQK